MEPQGNLQNNNPAINSVQKNSDDEANKNILTGGIQNAVERGQTVENAKQSFINAGYSSQEVEQAAQLTTPQQKISAENIAQNQNTNPASPQNSDNSSLKMHNSLPQKIPSINEVIEQNKMQTTEKKSAGKASTPIFPHSSTINLVSSGESDSKEFMATTNGTP